MRRIMISSWMVCALALSGCGKKGGEGSGKKGETAEDTAAPEEESAAPDEAAPEQPGAARAFRALRKTAPVAEQGGAAAAVDHSDPASVVGAVFAAAKSGDTSALAGLCDPVKVAAAELRSAQRAGSRERKGRGGWRPEGICATTSYGPGWEEFEKYFAEGAVKGKPRITGESAEVDIKFGPGGSEEETVKLVSRDGKWYLSSF